MTSNPKCKQCGGTLSQDHKCVGGETLPTPTPKKATWFCNKCGRVGETQTREQAHEQHREKTPKCHYFPSWNWTPPPHIAEAARKQVEAMLRPSSLSEDSPTSPKLDSYCAGCGLLWDWIERNDGEHKAGCRGVKPSCGSSEGGGPEVRTARHRSPTLTKH